ncbi:MAG: hypothetical protein ACK2T5_07760 [Anaerolineales bacterium]|jgi:hypothetical protein
MSTIPNVSLQPLDLPDLAADWSTIGAFALTFNGYEHWGSFEACSELAERWQQAFAREGSLPQTLTELRTCLFFEQRRWRHYGYTPDDTAMIYIRALLAEIRARVLQGKPEI